MPNMVGIISCIKCIEHIIIQPVRHICFAFWSRQLIFNDNINLLCAILKFNIITFFPIKHVIKERYFFPKK